MLPHNTHREQPHSLGEVFSQPAALLRRDERILERVFWRCSDRMEACVLPFRPRRREVEEA